MCLANITLFHTTKLAGVAGVNPVKSRTGSLNSDIVTSRTVYQTVAVPVLKGAFSDVTCNPPK